MFFKSFFIDFRLSCVIIMLKIFPLIRPIRSMIQPFFSKVKAFAQRENLEFPETRFLAG